LPIKEVVTILPYSNGKVLLQLRDFNPRIVYPGCWGFFGGTVESGETPLQSAKRELSEEIGHVPKEIYALSKDSVSVPDEVMMYSFYAPLEIRPTEIILNEGMDFGLFGFQEILSKQLYSNEIKKKFPLINHPNMIYLVRKLIRKIPRDD
jgi:8-oxo-dGTP pyrophosphatase MutT (NUDIX family)|tara:strand:- start:21 stop:470 length:450 start_codon:yes stop_codon:yes gene_type:complete